MYIEEYPFHDETTYQVEELVAEEIELDTLPVDPRLAGLSPFTRRVIDTQFGGDVDEAIYQAIMQCNMYADPPGWAIQLASGARRGWKDPIDWAPNR